MILHTKELLKNNFVFCTDQDFHLQGGGRSRSGLRQLTTT